MGGRTSESTYETRRADLLARIVDPARGVESLKGESFGELAVEEAFEFMRTVIFGKGLEEEPQTAALMSALAAGARFWAPWLESDGEDFAWMHFSKNDESETGTDFALVVGTDAGYRICIGQSKRISKATGKTVNVSQPRHAADVDPEAPATLIDALLGTTGRRSLDAKHYQLTKLLDLIGEIGSSRVDAIYAFWPDDGGEPLYRTLDDVKKELAAKVTPGAKAPVQSIKIDPDALLRRLFIGYCDSDAGGLLQPDEATAVLETIANHCATTAMIGVGVQDLALNLERSLGWKKKAPPPPTTPTNTRGMQVG